jgi:hypothetical protein
LLRSIKNQLSDTRDTHARKTLARVCGAEYDFARCGGGWTTVSSKRLLLLLVLACVALLCPLLAAAQDADSQQSNKSSSTGLMVRRFALHYNGSFKRVSADEITQRLTQKGLLPLVEQPYDQTKLDLVKTEIKKIYKEKGIAVSAESVLNATSTPRYVEVFIEVFKL